MSVTETKTAKQAATIFFKAAQYIRRYGWQVSGMAKSGQPRCSMGALASAYPKPVWDKPLAKLMYETLQQQLNGMTLTQFNHKFKDGLKVAALYEQTAKALLNRNRCRA